jgi:flagellar protein FlaG
MSIQSIASSNMLTAMPAVTPAAGSQASIRAATSNDAPNIEMLVPATTTGASSPTAVAEQKQQIEAAVRAVKEFIQPMASNLAFEMDDDSGRTVIKITEASSGELIRQIPSEEMLEIAKALDRLQGLLVKQKA